MGPEYRPEGLPTAEGIVEEKPAAVLNLIPQHPKKHEKNNHNYGRDIATGGLGGDEKGQTPQEDYRHHNMKDHSPDREVGQGDPAEENQGEHHDGDDDVERHQAGQPDFVAIIRNAEKCFQHARVLVSLDAVHGRIEDKQNAGREQVIVKPLRIRRPAPSQQADKQDQKKKAQGQSQENNEPPPEYVKSVVS